MKPECHHPPFAVNVELEGGPSDAESEHVAEHVRTHDPSKVRTPLMFLGTPGYVSVIECSWCRNPNEFSRRRWWRR